MALLILACLIALPLGVITGFLSGSFVVGVLVYGAGGAAIVFLCGFVLVLRPEPEARREPDVRLPAE